MRAGRARLGFDPGYRSGAFRNANSASLPPLNAVSQPPDQQKGKEIMRKLALSLALSLFLCPSAGANPYRACSRAVCADPGRDL